MDVKVIWIDPAREDLREVVAYIAAENPEAAGLLGFDIYEGLPQST